MARKIDSFAPVVATANDLRSGAVVFRAADGAWTGDVAVAEVATDPAAAQSLLAKAQADHAACRVVEPVLIEVVIHDGRPRPLALRERIRATGPTIVPPASSAA